MDGRPLFRKASVEVLPFDGTKNTCNTYNTCGLAEGPLAKAKDSGKQNLTISLDRQTIRKAKIVAAKRSTSISGLLARQIEILVGEEEAYERTERQAMLLLEQGFHLGGAIQASRDELHER